MTKHSIYKNHMQFEENIEKLIKYGLEIINDDLSPMKDKKGKPEKLMLLEGLLLRSCAYWESFVEKEVIYLINLDSSKFKNAMRLPENTKLNLRLIKALIFSGTYRDFSNIERSKGNLNRFLAEKYNAFKDIDSTKAKKIAFVYKLRNYLSHYSESFEILQNIDNLSPYQAKSRDFYQ